MKLGFSIQKQPVQPLPRHAKKENSQTTRQKPLNLQEKKKNELQDQRQINLNCQQKGFRLLLGTKTHLQ